MSRRLRGNVRTTRSSDVSMPTLRKRESSSDLLTPTSKKRKRNKCPQSKSKVQTVDKAEADSTVMNSEDSQSQSGSEREPSSTFLSPSSSCSAHITTPPKATLLDLADAAATVELDNSRKKKLEEKYENEQKPEVKTGDTKPTAEETLERLLPAKATGSQSCELMTMESRSLDAVHESPQVHQLTDSNIVTTNANSGSQDEGTTMTTFFVENSCAEEVMEKQEPKEEGGEQNQEEPQTEEQHLEEQQQPTGEAEESETVITDADGNILISYNSNMPMDDLLRTLVSSAGINLDATAEDMTNEAELAQPEETIDYNEPREYHQLKTVDQSRIEKDVFMGEGPEEDYVQLAVLDEISMDQLVGANDQRYSAFQPYQCYARPKHSTKTKAAADRLRTLLHLPPEPVQLTRMRSRRQVNKQPLQPPMLNPALTGGPIEPRFLAHQMRATQVLQAAPPQRYHLRAMTLAPVPVQQQPQEPIVEQPAPSGPIQPQVAEPVVQVQPPTPIQPVGEQATPEAVKKVPIAPSPRKIKNKSEYIVIEKQERKSQSKRQSQTKNPDEKRHRYASDIAKLQKPTPLEAVLAQTQNQIVRPAAKRKGRYVKKRPSNGEEETVELVSQKTAELVGLKQPSEEPVDESQAVKNWVTKSGRVKRPMNAFMVWARRARPEVASMLDGPTNADVSVKLGDLWREMTDEEKEPYYQEAHRIRMKHNQLFPDWMYKPSSDNNKVPTQKRQSSPYWRNFVRFGNVEGFRIHTVPVPETSDGISGDGTEISADSILNDDQMANNDTVDAEVAATFNYATPVTCTVTHDDSSLIRQAFNISQHTGTTIHIEEDGKNEAIYVQLNDDEDETERAVNSVASISDENQKSPGMTPLQRAHLSNDYKLEIPFNTANLVPMIEPTSPEKAGKPRKKDKLLYSRVRRPPVMVRQSRSNSWLLPFDPNCDRHPNPEISYNEHVELPVYHVSVPVKTMSNHQQYYPDLAEPRDNNGATNIWDGFGTIESLSDTACSRYQAGQQYRSPYTYEYQDAYPPYSQAPYPGTSYQYVDYPPTTSYALPPQLPPQSFVQHEMARERHYYPQHRDGQVIINL